MNRVEIRRNKVGELMVFSQHSYRTNWGTDWSTHDLKMPHQLANGGKLTAQPWNTAIMAPKLCPPDPEDVLPSTY